MRNDSEISGFNQHDRAFGTFEHFTGNTAHQLFQDTRFPVRCDYNQVDLLGFLFTPNDLSGVAGFDIKNNADFLDLTMASASFFSLSLAALRLPFSSCLTISVLRQ